MPRKTTSLAEVKVVNCHMHVAQINLFQLLIKTLLRMIHNFFK